MRKCFFLAALTAVLCLGVSGLGFAATNFWDLTNTTTGSGDANGTAWADSKAVDMSSGTGSLTGSDGTAIRIGSRLGSGDATWTLTESLTSGALATLDVGYDFTGSAALADGRSFNLSVADAVSSAVGLTINVGGNAREVTLAQVGSATGVGSSATVVGNGVLGNILNITKFVMSDDVIHGLGATATSGDATLNLAELDSSAASVKGDNKGMKFGLTGSAQYLALVRYGLADGTRALVLGEHSSDEIAFSGAAGTKQIFETTGALTLKGVGAAAAGAGTTLTSAATGTIRTGGVFTAEIADDTSFGVLQNTAGGMVLQQTVTAKTVILSGGGTAGTSADVKATNLILDGGDLAAAMTVKTGTTGGNIVVGAYTPDADPSKLGTWAPDGVITMKGGVELTSVDDVTTKVSAKEIHIIGGTTNKIVSGTDTAGTTFDIDADVVVGGRTGEGAVDRKPGKPRPWRLAHFDSGECGIGF